MTEIPITLTSTFFKNTKIYKDLFMIEVIIDQYALNHQYKKSVLINVLFLYVFRNKSWLSFSLCCRMRKSLVVQNHMQGIKGTHCFGN